MMVDDTTIKLSSQEQGDPRRSQLAVSSNSRRPQITIQDIGIEEFKPGTYLILDGVDREAHIRCKALKGYILFAETEEIFNVLYEMLRDDGKGYQRLEGLCSNKQTFLPMILLERSHPQLGLSFHTYSTPQQHSSPARVSTTRSSWVFKQDFIQEPNKRLKKVSPDQWMTISKNIEIPTFEVDVLLEATQEIAQLPFRVSTSALDENKNPIENTQTNIVYQALFDNHHLKPLKEIQRTNREKLLYHREYLISELNQEVGDVIKHLAALGVLQPREKEDLLHPTNERKQVTELVGILLQRDDSLLSLILALEKTQLEENIKIAKHLRS